MCFLVFRAVFVFFNFRAHMWRNPFSVGFEPPTSTINESLAILESTWRNSRVFVYHRPLLSHFFGVGPSTFTMEYMQRISKSHVPKLETLKSVPQQIQDFSDISTNLQPSRKSVQAQQNSHTVRPKMFVRKRQTNTKNDTFRTF